MISLNDIKKDLLPLVTFLKENENKKVSTILDEFISLCAKKVSETTFHKDESGTVIALKDYYFKKWFVLSETPWGLKEKSPSGYNQMSKAGLSRWTKQQRDSEKAKSEVLIKVSNGELDPKDIESHLSDIEMVRTSIDLTDLPSKGYDTLEELLADMNS